MLPKSTPPASGIANGLPGSNSCPRTFATTRYLSGRTLLPRTRSVLPVVASLQYKLNPPLASRQSDAVKFRLSISS